MPEQGLFSSLLHTYHPKIHINVILPHTPRSPKFPFYEVFWLKFSVCILFHPFVPYLADLNVIYLTTDAVIGEM